MEKITRMTFSEAHNYIEKHNEELQIAYDAAEPVALEESDDPGEFIGRGLTAFKEYINHKERPPVPRLIRLRGNSQPQGRIRQQSG